MATAPYESAECKTARGSGHPSKRAISDAQRALNRLISEYKSLSDRLQPVLVTHPLKWLITIDTLGFQNIPRLGQHWSKVIDVLLQWEENPIKHWLRLNLNWFGEFPSYRRPYWKEISELINAWMIDVKPASPGLLVTPESLRMAYTRYKDAFMAKIEWWHNAESAIRKSEEEAGVMITPRLQFTKDRQEPAAD